MVAGANWVWHQRILPNQWPGGFFRNSEYGGELIGLGNELSKNRGFMLQALTHSAIAHRQADEELWADTSFAVEAVQNNPLLLKIRPQLSGDLEVSQKLFEANPQMFNGKYSTQIWSMESNDRKFAVKALINTPAMIKLCPNINFTRVRQSDSYKHLNRREFGFTPEELRDAYTGMDSISQQIFYQNATDEQLDYAFGSKWKWFRRDWNLY